MPIKKVIIDKAHRLYQLPPAINSFSPKSKKGKLLKKSDIIDLASFNWPIETDLDQDLSNKSFQPAWHRDHAGKGCCPKPASL